MGSTRSSPGREAAAVAQHDERAAVARVPGCDVVEAVAVEVADHGAVSVGDGLRGRDGAEARTALAGGAEAHDEAREALADDEVAQPVAVEVAVGSTPATRPSRVSIASVTVSSKPGSAAKGAPSQGL